MARYYSLEQSKSAIKVTHEKYGGMTEEFDLLKLLQMPSADVAPVKCGKWIIHPEVKNIYGGIYIECSECREKYVVQHIEDEKFCRNCGARMVGERKDDGTD